jgi:hypothetical protein
MPLTRKRMRDEIAGYMSFWWPIDIGRIIFGYIQRTEEEKMQRLFADSYGSIKISITKRINMWIHWFCYSNDRYYILSAGRTVQYVKFNDLLPSKRQIPTILNEQCQLYSIDDYCRAMNRLLAYY